MDKFEFRRQKLLRIKWRFCKGKNSVLADRIDRSPNYVSRMLYEPGKVGKKNIGEDLVDIIEAAFPGWLEDSDEEHGLLKSDLCQVDIKQYDEVAGAMGNGLFLRDQPGQITSWRVTNEWVQKNVPANTGKHNLCIVTGFGDSMRGMFNSGDPLIVDAGVRELKFDGVYFFRVGDEGFIKRLQRIPGDGIRVISKNPDYESWTITHDMDFEIFGRVLKVWKSEEF